MQNVELRKSSSDWEAVQLKPQHVKLSLRVNEAYEMKFYYEQAVDYPVDLYYLMDLSQSMEDDKAKLSALGDLLAETMQNLTSNFRLGFGSFVDKTVMPYVSTVPQKLQEPCDGCAAPYGFNHHMTLDTKTSDFAREVDEAPVSGNLDAPEGGFDAIMQAVVCKTEIGWRDKARKLLILSTDAGFHYAGDGKLGGIVTPNDGKCHMENNMYTHSTLLDYPSVSQINKVVKENSVNLIFAVTESELHIYEQLSAAVEGSSVGKLSNDSGNVVQLVVNQYEAITSVLEMKDNATSNVKVTYFSSCTDVSGPLRQTNKCSDLRVGSKVSFTAKIEVVKCPKDVREWNQKFMISPVGINESVVVDLEMICNCNCEQAGNIGYEENSDQCAGVGTYKCGVCQCPDDYFGRNCECSATNLSFQVLKQLQIILFYHSSSQNATTSNTHYFYDILHTYICFSLKILRVNGRLAADLTTQRRLCATTEETASAENANVCLAITRRKLCQESSASATTSRVIDTMASSAPVLTMENVFVEDVSATVNGTCPSTLHVSYQLKYYDVTHV